MTNQEAIAILEAERDCVQRRVEICGKAYKEITWDIYFSALITAFDHAISALKKQDPMESKTNDAIFPYVVGQAAEIFHEGKWHKGRIVKGYRFQDGIVTIETEDGRNIWCSEAQTHLYRLLKE